MSKKLKNEDFIEVFCDERVAINFLDKLVSKFSSKLEDKFKELSEFNANLKESITHISTDIINKTHH